MVSNLMFFGSQSLCPVRSLPALQSRCVCDLMQVSIECSAVCLNWIAKYKMTIRSVCSAGFKKGACTYVVQAHSKGMGSMRCSVNQG